ncbi:MAG TPA: 16S rRNA (uracil(1498)-N(3))-methyltransferase [Lactobacillaceae bacterium]|jgi:16S rRNA (uracil1498-N3)-methyltransferase
MQRYFLADKIEFQVGDTFVLPAEDANFHHFARVLRAKVGSKAEFVSAGHLAVAEVTRIDAQTMDLAVIDVPNIPNVELPFRVTVVVSPLKNDRSDWFVQKATELGVNQIIFTKMTRTVADWTKQQAKKQSRLEKIVQGAAEQAHRLAIPTVRFATWQAVQSLPKTAGLVAWEESARAGEQAQLVQTTKSLQAGDELVLVFGPEGGLTDAEIADLQAADFKAAGLGPRILRAETAPLYALSAVSVLAELGE